VAAGVFSGGQQFEPTAGGFSGGRRQFLAAAGASGELVTMGIKRNRQAFARASLGGYGVFFFPPRVAGVDRSARSRPVRPPMPDKIRFVVEGRA